MTAQRPSASRGPLLTVIAIVVLGLAGAGLWYLFFRPAGPAPVALGDSPTQAPATSSAAPSATEAPASDAGQTSDPSATAAAAGDGITGTWTIDAGVGSFSDFSGTFVGYRVQETLASIGAQEAVGRTPDVTGTVTADGTSITAAEITADLTTLQSDDPRRDGQLSRQALETSQFPTATFKLTQPIDLGSVPAEGATFEATGTGDLTLHGETRSVQIPLQARLQDGVVTIVGSLPIQFAEFGIAPPQSMMVLSVEDNGILELQLQLTRAA